MTLPTSRADARAEGYTRYLGGVCLKHEDIRGERYVSNAQCIKCSSENLRRWMDGARKRSTAE
jgi:hypothetical protein